MTMEADEQIAQDSLDLHDRINDLLMGQDILSVAIHAQLLRKTIEATAPGVWEQADKMVTIFHLDDKEAAH